MPSPRGLAVCLLAAGLLPASGANGPEFPIGSVIQNFALPQADAKGKKTAMVHGKRATVVQFSTTFCSECRAAKALISDVVSNENEIAYIEIDAESNLELVRKVDIRSTPTTLFLDRAGFEIARATGAPKRDQLIKVIASL